MTGRNTFGIILVLGITIESGQGIVDDSVAFDAHTQGGANTLIFYDRLHTPPRAFETSIHFSRSPMDGSWRFGL